MACHQPPAVGMTDLPTPLGIRRDAVVGVSALCGLIRTRAHRRSGASGTGPSLALLFTTRTGSRRAWSGFSLVSIASMSSWRDVLRRQASEGCRCPAREARSARTESRRHSDRRVLQDADRAWHAPSATNVPPCALPGSRIPSSD